MANSVFRDDILEGKVALITGRGLGLWMGSGTESLADGARAATVSRKVVELEAAAKAPAADTGRECLAVAADVREPPAIESDIDATRPKLRKIDLVINGGAGI